MKGYHSAVGGAQSASKDWYLKISEYADTRLLTDKPSTISRMLAKTPLSFLSAANPLTFLKYAIVMSRRLEKVCKEYKPDLIHIQSYSGYSVIPPKNIPTVVTLHDEPFLKLSDRISPSPIRLLSSLLLYTSNLMRKLMLSRSLFLHATGTTTEILALERYPRIVSKCIPNPAVISQPPDPTMTKSELLELLNLPQNSILILTVGNINFRKALHKILDAASAFSSDTNIQFVIVGKTANFISSAYLRAVLKRASPNRKGNFHLTGFVSDDILHNLYSYADIYLSVSQSEACNLSLIEAASYGIPIVATEVGAAKDLFERQIDLLPRNSTVNEIVSSITKKLGSPRTRYLSLENLNDKNTVQEMLKFYQQILQKSHSTR